MIDKIKQWWNVIKEWIWLIRKYNKVILLAVSLATLTGCQILSWGMCGDNGC